MAIFKKDNKWDRKVWIKSNNLLNLNEKADTILEMEQELIKSHMEFLKEESILLKEKSKLLNKLQNIGENDIDGYVNEIEVKVIKKLEMYKKYDWGI